MAQQSSFYNTDGTTRTYPSSKHIASKQHVAVYFQSVTTSTWSVIEQSLYDLVNNSIVFTDAPDSALYSQIEIRVADTAAELTESPSDIAIVAGAIADVSTVAGNTTNINTVATNIGAVQTVSGNIANVTTVATNIANVNTVAGNNSNVTTVAGISGNVTTVAGISANVTTVAGNTANINTVATDISAVTTVANDLNEPVSEIETVAGSIANVNTVGIAIANVNTVAGSITNVNTVGTNIANVNSVAITVVPNIAEILLADDNATTATAKALEAQHWANYTTDVAVPEGTGEFSAKHYATKASEYAASVNPSNIMHLTGNESASGVKTFTDGINAPQLVGFKNYIINGNFDIWQRATSQTSSGYGSDDRWNNANVGSTKTHSQVACTDTERALFNAAYFSRTVCTYVDGTNSFIKKSQHIEDITKLAGKTVTLSFWARANSNKKMNLQLVDFYGTGGTPSTAGSSVYSLGIIDLTSNWTKFKVTTSVPSIIGKTLGTDGVNTSSWRIDFTFTASPDRTEVASYGLPSGQSGTFDIAQVQIEEGSVATPFEQRPYGLELSLCQRYYEVGQVTTIFYGTTSMGWQQSTPYKNTKRVIPTTVVVTPTGHTNIGTIIAGASSKEVFIISGTVVANGNTVVSTLITASAEL